MRAHFFKFRAVAVLLFGAAFGAILAIGTALAGQTLQNYFCLTDPGPCHKYCPDDGNVYIFCTIQTVQGNCTEGYVGMRCSQVTGVGCGLEQYCNGSVIGFECASVNTCKNVS